MRDLIDLLLPAGCVSCGGWIPKGGGARPELVCAACRMRMRAGAWPRCPRCHWPRGTGRTADTTCRECEEWPETIAAARFAYELATPATDLVHGLKYEGWRALAIYMGDAMARLEDVRAQTETSTVVVPVPTTRRRLRTRGYNQAELLARRVAEVRELPMIEALERLGVTGSQTTLSREERRQNVREAFACSPAADAVRGRRVLLVDDVLTTGATVSAAADALSAAGAATVVVLTFARTVATGVREAA